MSDRGGGWRERLEPVGQPAVVVVEVPVEPGAGHSVYPGVLKTFVGSLLGLEIGADVFYRQPISGLAVVAVWTPGDAPYDALRALPDKPLPREGACGTRCCALRRRIRRSLSRLCRL